MINHTAVKLPVCLLAGLLAGCGGGGDDSTPAGTNTAFLNVSVPEFYFGTRNVGTTSVHTIELSNRSGDMYPINRLALNGEHADEFEINFVGGVTLQPSQKIAVDVSFTPLSDGRKTANIEVDYDIIEQVTEADNLNEQIYYTARSLEDRRKYSDSLELYDDYINAQPKTVNKSRAAIKLPVLAESQRQGEAKDFQSYMAALNSREAGSTEQALGTLESLLQKHPDSYLADDAQYLRGYIELVDRKNYDAALTEMVQLQQQHPDSTYVDTAIYSEALALEELGDTVKAKARYQALLQRHRSDTWAAISLNVAKDNIVSRLWFDRANQGLDRLDS